MRCSPEPSSRDTTYRLEFFANTEVDPSGHGEGEVYLGYAELDTNHGGNVAFNVLFEALGEGISLSDGMHITSTATSISGNTSEFSEAVVITSPGLF